MADYKLGKSAFLESNNDLFEVHMIADAAGNIITPASGVITTSVISTVNSRSASTLAALGTFQGTVEDVSAYGSVGVSIVSDNATDGVLTFEVSRDGITWGGPTRTWSDTRYAQPHMWLIVEKYFRILYTNGTTEATNLAIQTRYSSSSNILLGHQLNETLLDETESVITRSVGVGQSPDGTYTNIPVGGSGFSSSSVLTNGETYDSGVLSLVGYTQVQTDISAAGAGGDIIIDFCTNSAGTVVRSLTIPYVADSGFKMFSAPAFTPYVRYRFNCTASGMTSFWFDTKFTTQAISGQLLGVNDFISSSMSTTLGRNILVGQTDGGDFINVPLSVEGHLEVAIHDPLLPFGSIHTENLTPVFQVDAVYGINTKEVKTTTGLSYDPGPALGSNSGSIIAANSMFHIASGTTAYSFGSIQSRKRLRYRPGQGVINRFTALFSSPAASSIVVAGCGSGEAGYFYGYNGTEFGILHSTDGVREIQTFTVSSAATTGGTITFRLNGIDTLITIPTSATTTLTANEIAKQTFPGWSVEASGSTVVFLASSVGNKTGTFSITNGTAVGTAGTFAETIAGVAATDTWITQANWNGDICDGTGRSGFIFDPTKGNVFQINIAWLGFGPVQFKILVTGDTNNPTWVTVHTIVNANTRTTPHANQPSFPFSAAAYSAGSVTDVSVSIGSFAGFIEGKAVLTGPRASFSDTSTSVTANGDYHVLFSVRNDLIHSHPNHPKKANQSVVNVLSFGGAHDDATPITYFLLRDATLIGPTSWEAWAAESCMSYDTGATTCTFTDNLQIIQVIPVGQAGSIQVTLEDITTLQPGETLTVAAKTTTGTSTWTLATLNTREDQ